MELYLKITAGLLLVVQAFHLASLQDTTDTPGRTIDKSWLRDLHKNTAGSQNAKVNEDDMTALDSSSGIASGSMATNNDEEENAIDQETNTTSEDLPDTLAQNGTTIQSEYSGTTVSPTTTTSVPTNSSQSNMTKDEDSTMTPQTSTTDSTANNSTAFPYVLNSTKVQSTTFPPENNATQEPTTQLTDDAESDSTTTAKNTTPEINETSTTFSSTTAFPFETTEMSTVTMTTTAVNTPVKANKTDKDAALGSSSERGTVAVLGITLVCPENCFMCLPSGVTSLYRQIPGKNNILQNSRPL